GGGASARPRDAPALRYAGRGGAQVTRQRIYVPRDAAALSVGADETAQAIVRAAAQRNADVELVRNGSRGLLWLEPLVEVETPGGRIAYGPVTADDVTALFEAGWLQGEAQNDRARALRHGVVDEIPFFKRQQRLTFARCG